MSSDDEGQDLFVYSSEKGIVRYNFYLAKDLPAFLTKWLTEIITSHSGRIHNGVHKPHASIPSRGYILVVTGSREAEVLRRHHEKNPARSGSRHLVDWKFVPACVEAHRLLSPEEIPEGSETFCRGEGMEGWPVFVWPKGSTPRSRLRLAYLLSLHGAQLVESEEDATFIVCDEKIPSFQIMTKRYLTSETKFVETPLWVTNCIKAGRVKATPTAKKQQQVVSQRGRAGMPYTDEDDRNLCAYLARRVPKDVPYTSSRLGMNQYDHLVTHLDIYPWATRHPAQSWRQRYKDHRQEFDQNIERLLRLNRKRPAEGTNESDERRKRPRSSPDALILGKSERMPASSSSQKPPNRRAPAAEVFGFSDEDNAPLPASGVLESVLSQAGGKTRAAPSQQRSPSQARAHKSLSDTNPSTEEVDDPDPTSESQAVQISPSSPQPKQPQSQLPPISVERESAERQDPEEEEEQEVDELTDDGQDIAQVIEPPGAIEATNVPAMSDEVQNDAAASDTGNNEDNNSSSRRRPRPQTGSVVPQSHEASEPRDISAAARSRKPDVTKGSRATKPVRRVTRSQSRQPSVAPAPKLTKTRRGRDRGHTVDPVQEEDEPYPGPEPDEQASADEEELVASQVLPRTSETPAPGHDEAVDIIEIVDSEPESEGADHAASSPEGTQDDHLSLQVGSETQQLLERRAATASDMAERGRDKAVPFALPVSRANLAGSQDDDLSLRLGSETQRVLDARAAIQARADRSSRASTSRLSATHARLGSTREPIGLGKGKGKMSEPSSMLPPPSRNGRNGSARLSTLSSSSLNPRSQIAEPISTWGPDSSIPEDSDEHFAGLDSMFTEALSRLAAKYRFSKLHVRSQFERSGGSLRATHQVLKSNWEYMQDSQLDLGP